MFLIRTMPHTHHLEHSRYKSRMESLHNKVDRIQGRSQNGFKGLHPRRSEKLIQMTRGHNVGSLRGWFKMPRSWNPLELWISREIGLGPGHPWPYRLRILPALGPSGPSGLTMADPHLEVLFGFSNRWGRPFTTFRRIADRIAARIADRIGSREFIATSPLKFCNIGWMHNFFIYISGVQGLPIFIPKWVNNGSMVNKLVITWKRYRFVHYKSCSWQVQLKTSMRAMLILNSDEILKASVAMFDGSNLRSLKIYDSWENMDGKLSTFP